MAEPIITTGLKAVSALEAAAKETPGVPVAMSELDIGELSSETLRYLTQASGGPIGELWARPGDWLRFRRWKRAIERADEARRILAERARQPRQVPDDVLVPLLEAASLSEDESIAAKWATLLANATDPAVDAIPPSFPNILRELTPDEARLLDAIHDRNAIGTMEIANGLGLASRWPVAFDNLVRLRLATHPFNPGPIASEDRTRLMLTDLGRAFVAACRSPGERPA
jgi:Abortive infection alpha